MTLTDDDDDDNNLPLMYIQENVDKSIRQATAVKRKNKNPKPCP